MPSFTSTTTATTTTALTTVAPTSNNRIVRFDQECVLIPDPQPSKRARMLTKSYSLPLWKKRAAATTDSDSNDDPSSPPQPDDSTHVVLKVPIPIFNMSTRSQGRGRTPQTQPLSPCLVQKSLSTSESPRVDGSPVRSRPAPARRTSLPPPGVYHNHKAKDGSTVTVPLRECCPDCIATTEQSLMKGDDWKEKFTRAARRRRSTSLDSTISPTVQAAATENSGAFANIVHPTSSPNSSISSSTTAMTATSTSTLINSVNSVMEPASPVVLPFAPGLFITVDEVDKRRKSLEHHDKPESLSSSLHRLRKHGERESSASSDELHTPVDSIPHHLLPRKASPIFEEEDEDQLFPLPSPRRTPTESPTGSPAISLNSSPVPSPNTSSSCLGLASRCLGNSSKDSLTCVGKCPFKRCKRKYLSPESASLLPPKLRNTLTSSPTPSSSSSSLSASSRPTAPASMVIASAAVPPSAVLVGSGPRSGSTASLPRKQQQSKDDDWVLLLNDVDPTMDDYPEPPSPLVLHPSLHRKERGPTPEPEPVSVSAPPIPSTKIASSSSSSSPPQRSASPSSPSAAPASSSPLKSKRASLSIPIPGAHHSRSSSVPGDILPSSSPVLSCFLSKLMTQPQPGQGQGQEQGQSRSVSPPLVPTAPASPTTPTRQATFPAVSSSFGSISGSGSPPGRATTNGNGNGSNKDRSQNGKRASFTMGSLPINIPALSKSKGSSFLKAGADVLRGIHASGGGLGVGGTGFGSP